MVRPSRDPFDVLVIGGGPGGYVASIRAAQLGLTVACIEKGETLGGTCLNVGCIPSKALLESSNLFHMASTRLSAHGIATGGLTLDLPAMMSRKEGIVRELTSGIEFLFKKNKIEWIHGSARLVSPVEVVVEGSEGVSTPVRAKAIVLATGSVPMELPDLAVDAKQVISSTEALSLGQVPEHLVVVGGGAIGLELGLVWHRLGAQVTVLEMLPRIIPTADHQISRLLQRSLKAQGMRIHTGSRPTRVEPSDRGLRVIAEGKGKTAEFLCDKLLVAVGRRPCVRGLGLEGLGVKQDPASGRIQVDGRYATNVDGIYAIGDLIQGPMLAHKAQEEGIAVAERIAGMQAEVNYRTIPSVVYTWPEVAGVGLTEEQAREEAKARGARICVATSPFSANGRACCMDEKEGLVKIIAEEGSNRILGVHLIGPHASELVAEAALAMELNVPVQDIVRTCHAHPTLAEAIKEAALGILKRPLHA